MQTIVKKIALIALLLSSLLSQSSAQSPMDSLLQVISSSSHVPDVLDAHLKLGIELYNTSAYELAQEHFLAVKENGTPGTKTFTHALNNLGNLAADKGQNTEALQYYQTALTSADAMADEKSAGHIRKNIGALYLSWKQFDTAIQFYNEALQTALKLNDPGLQADCYNNLGTAYEQQEKWEEALSFYEKAEAVYVQYEDQGGIAMVSSNRAIVLKKMGNYTEAIKANRLALDMASALGDDWTTSAIMNNLGNAFGLTEQMDSALFYCKKSIDLAHSIGAIEVEIDAYENLANLSAKSKDFAQAFTYQQKFTELSKQFLNEENQRQLNELAVKHETKKKTEALASVKREKALIIKYGLVVLALVLVLSVTIFFIVLVKRKRAADQALSAALFHTEQEERQRIARELHDSIGQQLTVILMQLQAGTAPAMSLTEMVKNAMSEVRSITQKLMPDTLQFGIMPALRELKTQCELAGTFSVELHVDESIAQRPWNSLAQLQVYRIVQETLSNMIKYSEGNTIKLQLTEHGEQMELKISDNGKGISKQAIESSTGSGWKNLRARALLLNARMNILSTPRNGTTIQLLWK